MKTKWVHHKATKGTKGRKIKRSKIAILLFLCALRAFVVNPLPVRAADSPPPDLGATQVSVAIVKGSTRRQFRATVMAKGDGTLTLLTAAHCVLPGDAGGPALLTLGDEAIEATVVAVVRNPAYRAGPGQQEAPGADNAVAVIRVEPGNAPEADALRAIQAAPELTARPVPAPSGQAVAIRTFDARGREHAVRAGNFSNHRWLEWGPDYRPIPGDSGGGVFVLRRDPEGRPRPVLIGVVVDRSDRGGGASLLSREQRWLADALPR